MVKLFKVVGFILLNWVALTLFDPFQMQFKRSEPSTCELSKEDTSGPGKFLSAESKKKKQHFFVSRRSSIVTFLNAKSKFWLGYVD